MAKSRLAVASSDDREIQSTLIMSEKRLSDFKKSLASSSSLPLRCDENLETINGELDSAKRAIKRLEIETRDMDIEPRVVVRRSIKLRITKMRELRNEWKWVSNEVRDKRKLEAAGGSRKERESLLGADDNGANVEKEHLRDAIEWDRDAQQNEDTFMDYSRKVQKQDIATLERVIVDVDQSKQCAADTAQKLQSQTEQIQRVDYTMAEIDSELSRARRTLIVIMRRLMGDKVIWFMIGIVALVLFFIIFMETGIVNL